MIIRPADSQDLPKIITLLKLALGESLMPKSEAYWRWKHIQNPFGPSPVLVAEQDGQLVGVRAFMRWEWQRAEKVLKAVRAVDTATHPEYQGKGIFKKLTLSLLQDCREEGTDFVFNTPNGNSKPGYINMGWQSAGRLPVNLRLKRPLRIVKNRFVKKPGVEFLDLDNGEFDLSQNLKDYTCDGTGGESWTTPKDLKFIQWRYIDVPVVNYSGYSREGGLVIFRLKQNILGTELRVVETIGNDKGVKEALRYIYRNIEFDYMSSMAIPSRRRAFAVNKFNFTFKTGPEVTIKALKKKDIASFINFKQWQPSLGDLELF